MKRVFLILVLMLTAFLITGAALADKIPDHTEALAEVEEALRIDPSALDLTSYDFTAEEILALKEKYPDTVFDYNVTMYGMTFSKDEKIVNLDSLTLRRTKELKELKAALPLFTQVEEIDMYNCSLSREDMEELWSTYPDIHWGWTLKLGSHVIRTDIEAFSSLHSPTNTHYTSNYYSILKYCWRIKALDLGHNKLTDISFIGTMKDLRVLILADNQIRDISPLANCTHLQYVELFLNKIEDLSPLLASKDSLLDLNICHGSFSVIDEVYQMPKLERLWITSNKHMSAEYITKLRTDLPNVEICDDCQGSTGGGWREHERYDIIYEMFNTYTYIPFSEE